MAADDIAAAGVPANLDIELEQSERSAKRLLETLARKVGAARAADYVKTHSPREMAAGLEEAAARRPLYALAAAVAAGFLIGCILKSSLRARE
jgi:hypothetical protein